MWGIALGLASKFTGKISPAIWKGFAIIVVGFVLGMSFTQRFLMPEPSVKYITKVVEAQAELNEIVVAHARRDTTIKIVTEIIEKEVIRYVPLPKNDFACNIPIGSVRLLNDARNGGLRESDLPSATFISDEEGAAASTISRAELIQSDAAIALQYNSLLIDHNALIDWIEVQQSSWDQ